MDKEVIKVLRDQKLFDWYFDNRNLVLLSVILLSISSTALSFFSAIKTSPFILLYNH